MESQNQLQAWLQQIKPLDKVAQAKARERLHQLTKPPGSLARLEEIVVQVAGITGIGQPVIGAKHVVVMGADHGVVEEGVSAFPQEVTCLMMQNFANHRAAVNVMARQVGAEVVVVDIGTLCAQLPAPVLSRKVREGTANMSKGPAMSRAEAEQAILTGIELAHSLVSSGSTLLALGEMGIGNTTASSAVAQVFLPQYSLDLLTGRGTGLDDEGLMNKQRVIRQAIEVNAPNPADPLDVVAKVGGLEIAGLAGVVIGAAASRCPVLVDGVIATAAALVASRIEPLCADYLLASHLSAEPAHALMLEELHLTPILHLGMRLGEGTGAVLAMPIVEVACRLVHEMATFADLGLPNPPPPDVS